MSFNRKEKNEAVAATRLSIIIPCFNEEKTLEKCIDRVLELENDSLSLEIVIVDDASTDNSRSIALKIAKDHLNVICLSHQTNLGKGAALNTGFQKATGDFIAVQDADLEYNPMDLKKLLVPLISEDADVVLGSRFLSSEPRRVLYFWHSMGNRFLTFLSNMFTDLNLTDMETCYKVFRKDVIQKIKIKEARFGVEPEIVAKIAHMRLRIYEIGISYNGRTYDEGKKISAKDGFRAIYCIFRYNAHKAPLPVQFLLYLFIGGGAAVVNLISFLFLYHGGIQTGIAAPVSFIIAALVNYKLCILLLFRHKVRWSSGLEFAIFAVVVFLICGVDYFLTNTFIVQGFSPGISKITASLFSLILNFSGRRFLVFPEPPSGPWV